MKLLDQFFQNDIVHALGWTIIHSFWQGLLIVLVLTVGLVFLRRHSSQMRYLAGYLALFLLTLCSAYTFFWSFSAQSTGAVVSTAQIQLSENPTDVTTVALSETISPTVIEENYWQAFMSFVEGNLPFITMIWMLGVLILSLRFLAELAYVQRLKHQPGQLSADRYQDHLNQLAERMGIRKWVELKENIRIDSPMVIGFIKPVILVPFGLLSRLDPQQVESVLAHELAHIRRHDYLLNLFQSLVEIVLFFNPATWWISSFIRAEREHCCDDLAIAQTGDQLIFVQTLAKLEEYRTRPGSMAMAFTGRRDAGVLGRIKRILNSEEQFRLPYKIFWSSLILLGTLGLFAFQDQATLSPDNSPEDQKVLERTVSTLPANLEEIQDRAPGDAITNAPNPDRITKHLTAAEGIISSADSPNHLLAELDTVPENGKALRQELLLLEKSYQARELALQKQSRDIQTQVMQLKAEMQQMENDQLKKIYELEKSAQEIELNRNFKLRELEVAHNTIENETLELQYNIQQLETAIQEEGVTEERQKQHSALHRQLLELEKKKRELALTQKRNDLDIDKEMQLLNNKRWQLQQEAKINQSNKQLEIMKLEQQMQEIQFQSQLLQKEKQNQIQLLRMQMQEAAEK